MSKHFKYVAGVFVMALMIGAIESTPAYAGANQHGGLDEICLCFGRFFNGFNATGLQPNGRCARGQTGPFCFVDTRLMPLFWKVQENCEEERTVGARRRAQLDCRCDTLEPPKMVVSCGGAVSEFCPEECTTPPINTTTNVFPTADGSRCRLRMLNEMGDTRTFVLSVNAICASPGMPPPQGPPG